MAAWVRNGGTLLLLDGGRTDHGYLQELVGPCGMRIVERPVDSLPAQGRPQAPIRTKAGEEVGQDAATSSIVGGRPILREPKSGAVLMASIRYGAGRVVCSTTRTLFSDVGLGYNQDVPTDPQFKLISTLFGFY